MILPLPPIRMKILMRSQGRCHCWKDALAETSDPPPHVCNNKPSVPIDNGFVNYIHPPTQAQQSVSQENTILAISVINVAAVGQAVYQENNVSQKNNSVVPKVSPLSSAHSDTASDQGSPTDSLQNSPHHPSGYLNVSLRGPRSCTEEDLKYIKNRSFFLL